MRATLTLEDFQWVARPIVIFADTPADPRVAEQLQLLADRPEPLLERDVVIIVDTDPSAQLGDPHRAATARLFARGAAKGRRGRVPPPRPRDVREIMRGIDKLLARGRRNPGQSAVAAIAGSWHGRVQSAVHPSARVARGVSRDGAIGRRPHRPRLGEQAAVVRRSRRRRHAGATPPMRLRRYATATARWRSRRQPIELHDDFVHGQAVARAALILATMPPRSARRMFSIFIASTVQSA